MEVRRLKKEGAYFCWTGPLRATKKMGVEVWARFWEWAEGGVEREEEGEVVRLFFASTRKNEGS